MMYQATVITEQKKWMLDVPAGTLLLDVCRENGISVSADCNGKGICGKCTVQVSSGVAEPAPEDFHFLTKAQLEEGVRLACRLRVQGDLTVFLKPGPMGQAAAPQLNAEGHSKLPGSRIAVDLGSTTLAAALLDASGQILSTRTAENSQRIFGADVLSRIQAANAGHAGHLQELIRRDLLQLFQLLAEDAKIDRIAIAGNAAMLHLLRGYPCEGLARWPFVPYNLQEESLPFCEVFGGAERCRVNLLPGFSAFVGADIAAGLYSSGFLNTPEDKMSVFVDLGTNGELAVGNRNHFFTASTAAGPAFEGGGISCGMPGVPGAISQVEFLYHRIRVRTIGQKKPRGICGTGALDAVAALRKEGLLDANGLLMPKYFQRGVELACGADGKPIMLTQEDVRQIQLAKAAVRAGIETLCSRYQQRHPSARIDKVYVAGGFGHYLSAKTALAVGLFPGEWEDKLAICGNASLQGTIEYLSHPQASEEMNHMRGVQESISLAEDALFSEYYMEQMAFPD